MVWSRMVLPSLVHKQNGAIQLAALRLANMKGSDKGEMEALNRMAGSFGGDLLMKALLGPPTQGSEDLLSRRTLPIW